MRAHEREFKIQGYKQWLADRRREQATGKDAETFRPHGSGNQYCYLKNTPRQHDVGKLRILT